MRTEEYNKKVGYLSSQLLKMAAEKFSNHGCNDLPDGIFKGWTEQDKEQFFKDGAKWNRGDLEMEDLDHCEDWVAMHICSYVLRTNNF